MLTNLRANNIRDLHMEKEGKERGREGWVTYAWQEDKMAQIVQETGVSGWVNTHLVHSDEAQPSLMQQQRVSTFTKMQTHKSKGLLFFNIFSTVMWSASAGATFTFTFTLTWPAVTSLANYTNLSGPLPLSLACPDPQWSLPTVPFCLPRGCTKTGRLPERWDSEPERERASHANLAPPRLTRR